MQEFSPRLNEIRRGEVVDAYRQFVESGIKNPGDLDPEDPEVKKQTGFSMNE